MLHVFNLSHCTLTYTYFCSLFQIKNKLSCSCKKIEEDFTLNFERLARKGHELFDIRLSKSTVHSYLQGRIITLKKTHYQPISMNTEANKVLR